MAKELNKYDRLHLRNLNLLERKIEKIYFTFARELAVIASMLDVNDLEKPFSFDDYPSTKKRVDNLLNSFQNSLSATIISGVDTAWTLSNKKNDDIVKAYFGENVDRLTEIQFKRYFSTRDKARESFLERKTSGLNLSEKVWRYKEQFKQEIELGLDIGIADGISADEMSRNLRDYLRHPDKLFRRVRDKHGNLVLSKAAKAFNPGQGVYRSSYKNARRLAATETNIAYRSADFERWQNFDFVLGIDIHLSNNHTLNGQPFVDICDLLAGRYPKDFKFTGWHPLCRCMASPVLMKQEEFLEKSRRKLRGEQPIDYRNNENNINDVPKNFRGWIDKNKERAKGWSSMPYFVRQNPHYIQGFEVDTYTKAEWKFTRARKTNEAMEESLGLFLQRKYPEIPNTEKAAIFHYTKGEGAAFRQLNNQLRKGNLSEFNEAFSQLLSQGLSKLETTSETVYRKVRFNKTNLGEYLSLAGKKGTSVFKGFTSTSLDRQTAIDFRSNSKPKKNETDVLFVIRGKSGHPIEDFSQFGGRFAGKPNQREVLFDKGCKFRFDEVKQDSGIYVFYLTEI